MNKKVPGNSKTASALKALAVFAVIFLSVLLLLKLNPPSRKTFVRKLANGHYVLISRGRPFIIKGVCYNPIPVGNDQEYDWWSDPYKPWLKDGKLMSQMGVNTIRVYQAGPNPENVKKVISELYTKYGIRTIIGNWLGFWNYPCPFYGDDDFRKMVKKEVVNMVNLYKAEPGVLMWVLGNENNYSCIGQVNPWTSDEIEKEPDVRKQQALKARTYYSFINELVNEIHKIDPDHPVALGNGELVGLDIASKACPDVDLIACVVYRGKTFGPLFKSLKATFDKPIYLSEFGADSFNAEQGKEDQNMQAFYLESQMRIIWENLAGSKSGTGNCLGGTLFEWSDEWWKHNEASAEGWAVHDTVSNWSNGNYYHDIKAYRNMNMNEEWFGIVSLNPEEKEAGLDKRVPRKAYYVIRDFWKNPITNIKKRQTK